MSKYRQAARVDENQCHIVSMLRSMGATVQTGMDDLLVGYKGRTFWFEVKDPDKTLKQDGEYKAGAIKPSQKKLLNEWEGHYQVVHSFEQIVEAISL